jgi:hypothetical protein
MKEAGTKHRERRKQKGTRKGGMGKEERGKRKIKGKMKGKEK